MDEIPVKRGRGRPKGSKEVKPRIRRDRMQIALDGIQKSGKVSNSFLKEFAKYQTDNEKLEYCLEQYKRAEEQRAQSSRALTAAIRKMSKQAKNTQAGKVNLNAFIPVDLMHAFNDILEESPLNRNEILSNLILNFVKAHKSFSRTELVQIQEGVTRLEKQTYKNTKVAAEMLANAPYDAVRHRNPAATSKKVFGNDTHDEDYAKRVDERYSKDEVIKALEKNGGEIDMSDLFEDRD